jgi:hypothetical protein
MVLVKRQPGSSTSYAHRYYVYGLRLDSAWPLPYPRVPAPSLAGVSLLRGTTAAFQRALGNVVVVDGPALWGTASLPDGSRYLRWSSAFEFLIPPDGRSVTCRPLTPRGVDAFHTHLGPSLSFAMINLGFEPLHSTTVVIDGQAVALMGDCGYGKSSLGASFVKAGYRLLTDDLLVTSSEDGQFLAYPGAPRVKLYPAIAKIIFGPRVKGLRLEPLTPKLIIPLDEKQSQRTPVPLRAIYVLRPPGARTPSHVVIRKLSHRSAFVELVRNTFNMSVSDPGRLERQFALASRLAMTVPIKSLSYPRKFGMLHDAREAILADVHGGSARLRESASAGTQDPPYVRRSAAAKK